jgi:hypothetical protein
MSFNDALTADIDEVQSLLKDRKVEALTRYEADLEELERLRMMLEAGNSGGSGDVRMKIRAIRHRHFGADDGKRADKGKAQDVKVRMKAPLEPVGSAVRRDTEKPKTALSRVVVQGTIQRELGVIESRMVTLLVDEGQTQAAPEVCFLADLRSGLVGLLRGLPEHDLLLGLVNDHLTTVDATLADLAAGGIARARRFFEHDRELLGRLRAMLRAEGHSKTPAFALAEKFAESLKRARTAIDAGGSELITVSGELEQMLMTIHKELQGQGFVASKSLLFNALRS